MSDYEELIKNLRSVKDTWQTQEEEWMLQAADAIEKLMALTSADVKPMVKGEWISVPHKRARICSHCECDEPYKFAENDADVYNVCPNCGADMRSNHG